ncbi:MAG: hypothetical protein IPH32_13270 [Bacteroidetes bacterium]|nr:hypothetical protein [Bacteroidota bacterium]
MDKVVIFADHTIGYWLTEYLLQNQKNYFIADVYTNETANAWWDDLRLLQNYYPIKIKLFDPDTTYLELKKTNPDYLLLLSWKHLIKKNILENVKVCTVNLHYSLLPKHRGVYPVNWAIYSGDTETGITFHIVDEKVDNGPIVGQLTEKISVFDDAFSLIQKLDILALKLFKKNMG